MKNIKIIIVYIALLIIPLFISISTTCIDDARGLRWQADPNYHYLNSIVSFDTSTFWLHPGITIKIFAKVVMKPMEWIRSADNPAEDVFKYPADYLSAISSGVIFITLILMYLLGLMVYKTTGNLFLGILIQLTPFFSVNHQFNSLIRVTAWSFTFFACMLVTLCILFSLKSKDKYSQIMLAVLFGVTCAFGLASKLTFLPILVLPLIVLRGIKSRVIYLISVGFSFFVFSLFLGKTFFKLWAALIHWFTHSKGVEPAPWFSERFFKSLNIIINSEFDVLFVTAVAVFLCLFILIIPNFRKQAYKSTVFRALLALTVAQILQVAMVARQLLPSGYSMSWLNPTRGFVTPVLLFICLSINSIIFKSFKYLRIFTYCLAVFIIIYCTKNQIKKIPLLFNKYSAQKKCQVQLENKLLKDFDGYTKIYANWDISHIASLMAGELIANGSERNLLNKLYPGVFIYEKPRNLYYHLGGKKASFNDILAKNNKVIFIGNSPKYKSNLIKKVAEWNDPLNAASIYVVKQPEADIELLSQLFQKYKKSKKNKDLILITNIIERCFSYNDYFENANIKNLKRKFPLLLPYFEVVDLQNNNNKKLLWEKIYQMKMKMTDDNDFVYLYAIRNLISCNPNLSFSNCLIYLNHSNFSDCNFHVESSGYYNLYIELGSNKINSVDVFINEKKVISNFSLENCSFAGQDETKVKIASVLLKKGRNIIKISTDEKTTGKITSIILADIIIPEKWLVRELKQPSFYKILEFNSIINCSNLVTTFDSKKLPVGNKPRMIRFRVNPKVTKGTLISYGKKDRQTLCAIAFKPNGKLFFWGYYADIGGNVTLPLNSWSDICLTYDGETATLYLNNQQIGRKKLDLKTAETDKIIIGEGFEGEIADLEIWNKVLNIKTKQKNKPVTTKKETKKEPENSDWIIIND